MLKIYLPERSDSSTKAQLCYWQPLCFWLAMEDAVLWVDLEDKQEPAFPFIQGKEKVQGEMLKAALFQLHGPWTAF